MGLYLSASSKIEVLDTWNGIPGFYIKTFALNTLRNKNGWRVSWGSIDKRLSDFSDNKRPGILYEKCVGSVCDLDHTDGATYQASLEAQEPYRITDIIDTVKDKDTETGWFIHKITDSDKVSDEDKEKFKQAILDGTIQYVSPSVWPITGQYDIKPGRMSNGERIIDAYDWLALHDAFVNDPAFGDVARVTATCEGADCPVKLLTAAQLKAAPTFETQKIIFRMDGGHSDPDECDDYADQEYDINDQDKPVLPIHINCMCIYEDKQTGEDLGQLDSKTLKAKQDSLQPLEQIPVIIKHKGKLHFMSVSKKMSDDIQAQINFSGKLEQEQLPEIYKNNSFSSCTCSKLRMTPEEALKAKLTATEKDNEDKDEKVKKLESKLAAMEKEKEDAEKAKNAAIVGCAKCGSTDHTTDNHTKDNAKVADEPVNAKLNARLNEAESELSKNMVTEMLKARTEAGASVDEIANFTKAFSAKSLAEIKEIHTNESILLKAVTERKVPEEELHMPFNGATVSGSLTGKTLEQIAGESA